VKQAFAATYMPLARLARDSGGDVTDLTRAFIADVEPVAVDGLHTVRAQQEMANLHRDLAELFRRADILMLPTLAMPAPAAHDRFIDHAPQVNGREHQDRWIVGFTVPFNLVSQCPAVSLPAGWSRDGLPLAVQLVGRPYSDYALLDIAELLETGIRG
jgi:Asp-tRNA(Asn)/Glu-tRNA(Gln) amidotransferase A subunit family amidase